MLIRAVRSILAGDRGRRAHAVGLTLKRRVSERRAGASQRQESSTVVVVAVVVELGKTVISTFATAERGNMYVYVYIFFLSLDESRNRGVGGRDGRRGEEGNKDREPG